jgi:FkbM family methyltransferase
MKLNYQTKLIAEMISHRSANVEPFVLVDVGASGGIQPYWRAFGDSLEAVGFDPLTREIDRLNAEEKNKSVRYWAASVGYRRYAELLPNYTLPNDQSYSRSSSVRAQELLRCDYPQAFFDQTHSGDLNSELIELDDYFLRQHPAAVDFLKVDTDGHDYEVLLGAEQLLAQSPVMGVLVEAAFHGPIHSSITSFSTIDIFLRNRGFSLFDMDVWRYTRAALPKPFHWRLPANTSEGPVDWADCLYLRDAAIDGYEQTWNLRLSTSKLLKLCCLCELFSLEDCAAEILLKHRDRLEECIDVERNLDLLTPPLPDGSQVSYRGYNAFFNQNVQAFYPSLEGGKPEP